MNIKGDALVLLTVKFWSIQFINNGHRCLVLQISLFTC
uniref:Uncharacterized protein n=1 Tax=Arundo donax TaxID=35708 RepID=A0A0A9GG90_ARUDO